MAFTLDDSLYKVSNSVPENMTRISKFQSTLYDAETQLIRGTMSFSKQKLQELDPSYTGYTHIFVLRLPPFMTAISHGQVIADIDDQAQAVATTHCRNLKTLIEMGSTKYSGTPELTLNTSEVNTGFSERSYPAPTYSAYDSKSFTISCLETRTEPLRHAVEYYINGVTDANVKATTLHGAKNSDGTLMEPTLGNMTFSIMVVQTDQTLLRIQDISIWNNAMITSIDRSSLDWDNGTIDIVQPRDLQFSGVYMPDTNNSNVDQLAKQLMATRLKFYKRYKDMTATDFGIANWNGGVKDITNPNFA